MSKARMLTDEQYEAFYQELYTTDETGRKVSRYRVALDPDPSVNPMSINKKLSDVQAYKDRVVVILNDAIQNESYWRTISKNLESRFDSEMNGALTTESVKNSGNAGIQKAVALRVASSSIVSTVFNGEGKYDDHLAKLNKKLAEAIAFLAEVRHLYENLDATSMNLAIQLKSLMMNMRLYGAGDNGFSIAKEVAHGG